MRKRKAWRALIYCALLPKQLHKPDRRPDQTPAESTREMQLGLCFALTGIRTAYCHSGISVFDTSRHSEGTMKEEYLVMEKVEVAVNVNTKKDLELAEKLLVQRA